MSEQDSLTRTQVRIPNDVYRRLVEAAKASGRSMNAELVHRLGLGLEPRVDVPSYMKDEIAESAARNGRSFNAEIQQRLHDSGDPVIGWVREALEPVRGEIARTAEHHGLTIQREISNRLSKETTGMTFCFEITIKNEAELKAEAALKFLSELVEIWPSEARNFSSLVVRLVESIQVSANELDGHR